jgi:drug/metabolite transporter (DMT)-like permease
MCATVACFAALDTAAKFLSRDLPTVEVAWARYMVAGVFALIVSRAPGNLAVFKSSRLGLEILRSCLLLGSTLANFVALRKLQLAETSTIGFLQPMFVALLAAPLLGEKVGLPRALAIGVGFLGVIVATQPGTSAFQPIVLVSIAGAACAAGYALATRKVSAYDSPRTMLAWTQVAGIIALTPMLPFIWKTPPTALFWAVGCGMGFLAFAGHGLLILAHQRAPAAALTPFNYTQLVWMIILGRMVFGDVPPLANLFGAGLVVACGLFLVFHEHRSATPRSKIRI